MGLWQPDSELTRWVQAYDIHTSFCACAMAIDLTP